MTILVMRFGRNPFQLLFLSTLTCPRNKQVSHTIISNIVVTNRVSLKKNRLNLFFFFLNSTTQFKQNG